MPDVRTGMNAIAKSVILVVDDDALVRVHSNLALEDAGYEVVEASNAADALVKLEERPDIAILVTSGADNGTTDALPKAARFVQKPYTGAQLSKLLQL